MSCSTWAGRAAGAPLGAGLRPMSLRLCATTVSVLSGGGLLAAGPAEAWPLAAGSQCARGLGTKGMPRAAPLLLLAAAAAAGCGGAASCLPFAWG